MTQGNYAHVHGLELYYEIHGSGAPLILLHGGFGSTGMFGELLPQIGAGRQVILVDLQGHGRTADIARPLSMQEMADDVAALIGQLGVGQADVMGYSMGGSVALQTAIRHPAVVRKLVIVSSAFRSEGWFPGVRADMAQIGAHTAQTMLDTPMYHLYASTAPRPGDWPTLWAKMGDLMRQGYDWGQEVAALKVPTLFVAGDADSLSPQHAAEFFSLLGGGRRDGGWDGSGMTPHRLAILPATTHYDSVDSPLLAPVVTSFLDASTPASG